MSSWLRRALGRLCLAALLLSGCDDPATEVLVRVRAEPGLTLDGVTVEAMFANGTDDKVSLQGSAVPFTLPIGPQGKGDALRVVVSAEGTRDSLQHEARVRFSKGKTLLLDVVLSERCAPGACAAGQTCTRCGCGNMERELPQVTGSSVDPEAALEACTPEGDGGTNDGGANDGGANDGGTNDGGATDGSPDDSGTNEDGSVDPNQPRAYVSTLSLGDGHACFITQEGELYCWGEGGDGQLGRGALPAGRYPIGQVGSATDWRRLSVSPLQTCGTRSGGDVYCWGDVLGDLDFIVPERADGANAESALEAGDYWACGLQADGSGECWGAYPGVPFGGILALQPPMNGGVWDSLVDSTEHVYLLDDSDNLWSLIDTTYALERSGVAQAVRNGAFCDLLLSGALMCRGSNQLGQAGLGSTSASVNEGEVQVAGVSFVSIAGSVSATCALTNDGDLWCWGDNSLGAMGPNAVGQSVVRSPVLVSAAPAGDPYVKVEVGGATVCAVRESGLVDCWGGAAPLAFGSQGGALLAPN